tara:strand:+ start:725 stop:868 length:144 start_codon:yes stop_codon:yes gene_type:complete
MGMFMVLADGDSAIRVLLGFLKSSPQCFEKVENLLKDFRIGTDFIFQ